MGDERGTVVARSGHDDLDPKKGAKLTAGTEESIRRPVRSGNRRRGEVDEHVGGGAGRRFGNFERGGSEDSARLHRGKTRPAHVPAVLEPPTLADALAG